MSDTNAIKNPSTGMPTRNPSHIAEADSAADQSELVQSIRDTGVKRMVVKYDYSNLDKQSPPPLAGITKIREMSQEQAVALCKSLMRSKPNIFKVHIKLGEYGSARRLENQKTRMLNSSKARFHTEVAEKLGDLLSDKNMLVSEVKYQVHNAEPGLFRATAEVYGVNTEEYFDDEIFDPTIEFEFIKTT